LARPRSRLDAESGAQLASAGGGDRQRAAVEIADHPLSFQRGVEERRAQGAMSGISRRRFSGSIGRDDCWR
jgi:hypothetical protein